MGFYYYCRVLHADFTMAGLIPCYSVFKNPGKGRSYHVPLINGMITHAVSLSLTVPGAGSTRTAADAVVLPSSATGIGMVVSGYLVTVLIVFIVW